MRFSRFTLLLASVTLCCVSGITTSEVSAQVEIPSAGQTCSDLLFWVTLPDSGTAYPMTCIEEDPIPVPLEQSGRSLRQLIRTATLFFRTPLNAALPGRLWFSLSGESDVEIYGVVRRRAGSTGAVPALRLREP